MRKAKLAPWLMLLAASVLVALCALRPADGQDPANPVVGGYTQKVVPLFAKYCNDCHSGPEPSGGVAFDELQTEAAARRAGKTWEKVLRVLSEGIMPPPDAERPTSAELAAITGWIERDLPVFHCSGEFFPGRVTARRLNQAEYNNTIRDLVGVDFKPAKDFPADDIGYGFDNIGDVLSLSPIHLEKYLSAAEQIAQRAIAPAAPPIRYSSRDLTGGSPVEEARILTSTGAVSVQHEFAKPGRYRFRVGAYGDQAGGEPVKMAFRIDGKQVRAVDVPVERQNPVNYDFEADIKAGKREIAFAFLNDYYVEENSQDRNLYVQEVTIASLSPGDLTESQRQLLFVQPSPTKSRRDCSREVLGRFASRAFRRPVKEEELNRLVTLTDLVEKQGESFERGIQVAMQAVLVSPHFLFRLEEDPPPNYPSVSRPINDFELATRLSYFLWSSMPDDDLFRLADQRKLRENLAPQVKRMLTDPRAVALIVNFGGQWLQTRQLAQIEPDRRVFPSFDDRLRADMQGETLRFFESIMRDDRSILSFLDGDFTFVNERLAKHYGIPNVKGEEFQQVSLAGTPRRGLLTQASILTLTSNPNRTSPVKRGKWMLEQMLGTPPPPPPAMVPPLDESPKANESGSLRQRLEAHRAKAECATCHNRMDPLGFAFEHFDAIGRWRDLDGKHDVDPAGELPNGQKFSDHAGVIAYLRTNPAKFRRSLAEKMLTFALGRGLEYYDKCTLDRICEKTQAGQDRFSALVLAIVDSDAFQKRAKQGVEP